MHLNGMYLGSIRPSCIYVDEQSNVRMSALSFTNELLESERSRGTLIMNYEFMQYVSPEQLAGDQLDEKTDQYSLGVLAVQMLQGGHPFPIKKLADLLRLHELHANPRDFYGEWIEAAPELYHIILRMMQRDPKNRFDSMGEVYDALRPLVRPRTVTNPVEAIAKASYIAKIRGKARFYQDFYEALFTERDDLRKRFPNLSRRRQHRMLDIAIEQLLNFKDSVEPTTLSRTAARHVEFNLAEEDWDAFARAFIKCVSVVERDRDVVAAWRAALRPGMEYMKANSRGTPNASRDSSHT
jgi:serine/threonine protein kinase